MKKAICIILAIIASIMCYPHVYAHGSQAEHDKDLKQVLFGDRNYSLQNKPKQNDAFRAIADAAALCIDQFSSQEGAQNKLNDFNDLSKRVHLSVSFSQIDLNKEVKGVTITANNHRMFTHKGWNFSEYPDKDFWKKRKSILIDSTRQKVFNNKSSLFPWLSDKIQSMNGSSEQCDAFCAMVYYVHILGDHIEGDKPSKLTALEPLAQYESLSSPGIIPELQEYLQILFADQKNTRTFMSLMQELDALGVKAQKVYYSYGGINTEEKCRINMDNAKALLDLLGEKVHYLLKYEKFYINTFF